MVKLGNPKLIWIEKNVKCNNIDITNLHKC